MTLQNLCEKLQALAHDGHALMPVSVTVGSSGVAYPDIQIITNGEQLVIKGTCGRCEDCHKNHQ